MTIKNFIFQTTAFSTRQALPVYLQSPWSYPDDHLSALDLARYVRKNKSPWGAHSRMSCKGYGFFRNPIYAPIEVAMNLHFDVEQGFLIYCDMPNGPQFMTVRFQYDEVAYYYSPLITTDPAIYRSSRFGKFLNVDQGGPSPSHQKMVQTIYPLFSSLKTRGGLR